MSRYDDVLVPFKRLMETELHANAAKGDRPGWLSMTAEQCLLEIYYHVSKLQKAVRDGNGDRIKENTADVANMAMMLADICGALEMAQPSDGDLTNEGAEPVAWIHPLYLKDGALGFEASTVRLSDLQVPLYRHPPKVCTCQSGDGSLRWPCPVHPPEVKVVPPERLMEVLNFLTGTAGLDGFHYGDPHPSGRKFWWRNELRACLDRVKELNS